MIVKTKEGKIESPFGEWKCNVNPGCYVVHHAGVAIIYGNETNLVLRGIVGPPVGKDKKMTRELIEKGVVGIWISKDFDYKRVNEN